MDIQTATNQLKAAIEAVAKQYATEFDVDLNKHLLSFDRNGATAWIRKKVDALTTTGQNMAVEWGHNQGMTNKDIMRIANKAQNQIRIYRLPEIFKDLLIAKQENSVQNAILRVVRDSYITGIKNFVEFNKTSIIAGLALAAWGFLSSKVSNQPAA